MQAARNQARSRAARRQLALSRRPGAAPARPGRGASGAVAALAAGTASSLASAAFTAGCAIAVVALACAAVTALVSAAWFGLSQGSYSSMARVALAEYEGGAADGTYHRDDPKYWAFAVGTPYEDGASTPWCAAFVSWCADRCGYVDSGLFPKTAGVGQILAHFGSDPSRGEVVDIAAYRNPRPGDVVCYGKDGASGAACTDHVGIVVAVEGSVSEGYSYFYTVEGNTSSDGLGGDGARVGRHVFWNDAAGLAEDARWNLGGYWDHAKVIRPNYPEGALGEIEIPETFAADGAVYRVGTFATREWDPGVYSMDVGTDAWRVEQAWKARGRVYDLQGFSTLDGRYMIACTDTFGAVGDEIVFYFDNGARLACVMADTKDQSSAHGTPATRWGHRDFASRQICVLEFFGTEAIGANPYIALGLQGCRAVGAENRGPYV